MVSKLSDYMQLLRPRYHLLFLSVVIAGLCFGSLPLPETLLKLGELYLSFCVCLYGGLYTINGIGDRNIDALHPRKRHRPIAAGRISVTAAWIYAISLIALALGSAAILFGTSVVEIYVLFIVINVLYTYVLKHIPYIEFVGNSGTHPLRAVLGIMVTHGTMPIRLLLAVFLFALGTSITRRIIEKERGEESGRPSLKYYSLRDLELMNIFIAILMLLLWANAGTVDFFWYPVLFTLHCTTSFLRKRMGLVRKTMGWLLG